MSADACFLQKGISKMRSEEKDKFRKKIQPNSNGLLFLFVGQIVERKGVRCLLNAWTKFYKTHTNDILLLIGGGNQLNEFQQKYKAEPSIKLLGKVEYETIYKYYAIADVFIMPTIEDNWSLVVPEAMACGLPVSTSIYNGCHTELVHKDENGITFDPYKEETLIEALDYFHHQDLKKMGLKSVEIEKQFNTKNCALRVYQALTTLNAKG